MIPNFLQPAAPSTNFTLGIPKKWRTRSHNGWLNTNKRLKPWKKIFARISCTLAYFDMALEAAIHVDASDVACGFLSQKHDEHWKSVAYSSRKFSVSERILSTTDTDCLSILYVGEKLKHYIVIKPMTVYTDHASLQQAMSLRTQNQELARWSLRLSEFNPKIIHRSATANRNAYALSRSSVFGSPLNNFEPVNFLILTMQKFDLCSE